jgi:hypothetical protein
MRKQRLCWLLQNDTIKVSSDLKRRFIPNKSVVLQDFSSEKDLIWKSDIVSRGDIIVICEKNTTYIGTVFNFQKPNETKKIRRTFLSDSCSVSDRLQVVFLLNPLYKMNTFNFALTEISENNHVYFNKTSYKCHVQNYNVNFLENHVKTSIRKILSEK